VTHNADVEYICGTNIVQQTASLSGTWAELPFFSTSQFHKRWMAQEINRFWFIFRQTGFFPFYFPARKLINMLWFKINLGFELGTNCELVKVRRLKNVYALYQLTLSTVLTPAPCCNNSLTTDSRPYQAAKCRGVNENCRNTNKKINVTKATWFLQTWSFLVLVWKESCTT